MIQTTDVVVGTVWANLYIAQRSTAYHLSTVTQSLSQMTDQVTMSHGKTVRSGTSEWRLSSETTTRDAAFTRMSTIGQTFTGVSGAYVFFVCENRSNNFLP